MVNVQKAISTAESTIEREGFRVAAQDDIGLLRLQLFHRRSGSENTLADRLGFTPPAPGATSLEEGLRWYWSAPGEWVIAVSAGSESAVLKSLQEKLGDLFAVLTVMMDSRIALELTGERVREVLSRGSTVDFHPSRFRDGQCLSTRFAGVPVMIASPADSRAFRLFADRTMGVYLRNWFEAASRDC